MFFSVQYAATRAAALIGLLDLNYALGLNGVLNCGGSLNPLLYLVGWGQMIMIMQSSSCMALLKILRTDHEDWTSQSPSTHKVT